MAKKTDTTQQTSQSYVQQLQQIVSSAPEYVKAEYSNPYAEQMLALTAPKTDAEYKKLAQNYYMPQYNAQVEALQQAAAKEQLGYSQQLSQLATAYQDSQESLNAQQARNISELNNNMLRRGMARSTYASQIEANARTGWANALSKLGRDYQSNVNYVGQQQQLTTSQLAQSEARLKNDLAANIANYEQTLRGNDKSAQLTAYQQLSNAYDAWNQNERQLEMSVRQNQSSMQASLLQFLADYNLQQEQWEWQKAQATQANKKTGGTPATEPTTETKSKSPAQEWEEFAKANNTSVKNAQSYTYNGGNIYSAAAQYALEQIEKQLRGW